MSASITYLRDGHRLVSVEEEEAYRHGLQRLAAIGSGKKGSRQPRHVLEVRGNDTRVPPVLAAGSATAAAVMLCRWLEALRIGRPEELQWLLDKWIFRSERERGRMTLPGDAQIERAGRLGDSARGPSQLGGVAGSRRRHQAGTAHAHQVRG